MRWNIWIPAFISLIFWLHISCLQLPHQAFDSLASPNSWFLLLICFSRRSYSYWWWRFWHLVVRPLHFCSTLKLLTPLLCGSWWCFDDFCFFFFFFTALSMILLLFLFSLVKLFCVWLSTPVIYFVFMSCIGLSQCLRFPCLIFSHRQLPAHRVYFFFTGKTNDKNQD